MIVYFMDRKMNILGCASTMLPDALPISDDLRIEEVETGCTSFECEVAFDSRTREKAESLTQPGQYMIRSVDGGQEFYQIISRETDTLAQSIRVYAEDAGLDLINEEALIVSDGVARTMREWVIYFTQDSGFEIGNDESGSDTKTPWWDSESTVTERLLDLAASFGYEIYFSFQVDNLAVSHKYINIVKQRGKDIGVQLRLNKEIDNIRRIESLENVATSLLCVGATEDGTQIPVTLDGYSYDDGDMYTDGKYLRSRNAVAKWGRFVSGSKTDQHIEKVFRLETVSQSYLCSEAVKELKKISEMEMNLEVDIKILPDNVRIGDRVNIVDEQGNIFVSARLLRLETSITQNTYGATLGEYLIKSGGIPEQIADLAARFSELAASKTLYTWIAYADDDEGTGISLDPDGKSYIGISANHINEEPDLTEPSKYTWYRSIGADGEPAVTVKISASSSQMFKTLADSNVLTAHVYVGATEVTGSAIEALGTIKWYKSGSYLTGKDGTQITITAADVSNTEIFEARIEK